MYVQLYQQQCNTINFEIHHFCLGGKRIENSGHSKKEMEFIQRWKDNVSSKFYWALDVERDDNVANQVKKNQNLGNDIAKLKAYHVEREENNAKSLEAMKMDLTKKKATYEVDSQEVLASHDRMSVAGLIYEDIVKQIDTDMQSVQQVSDNDVGTFGFQSKIIFNLSMTVDALKAKVRSGLPYATELEALRAEVGKSNDIAMMTSPISGPLAHQGIPTHERVMVLGKETAESLLRATRQGAMRPTTGTQVAQSFFHRLKFDAPTPSQTVAEAQAAHHNHHHHHDQKLNRKELETFSTDFFDSINQRDYAEALRVAAEAQERLPPGTTVAKEFESGIEKFRAGVVPMMLAQNLFDYCDASLISTRYSFVSPVLEKILQAAAQEHDAGAANGGMPQAPQQ